MQRRDARSSGLVGDLKGIASSFHGPIGESGARDGNTSSGSSRNSAIAMELCCIVWPEENASWGPLYGLNVEFVAKEKRGSSTTG